MRIFNIKGIIIFAGIIILIQMGSAFLLSPLFGSAILDAINKNADAKITAQKITVWPLTLSCSIKDLKVFDPEDNSERIAYFPKTTAKISLIALLAKKIVVKKISINKAQINLKGEPDGSFNIQKIAKTQEKMPEKKSGLFDQFKKKKDWFGRIADMVRKKFSKKENEQPETVKPDKKAEKKIDVLPKGRRIRFVTPKDRYVFEIKNFKINKSQLVLTGDKGETLDIHKVSILVKNLALDPKLGLKFEKISAKGSVKKDERNAGTFGLSYEETHIKNKDHMKAHFKAKELDLKDCQFLYQDSIPVHFESGRLTVESKTTVTNGEVNSENNLKLYDHQVSAKSGAGMVGIVPTALICDALNKINPVEIPCHITGPIDKPKFDGFHKVILDLTKPYIADASDGLKEKGMKMIQGLFNK